MTQRTRTANELPDDDEDINVGDDVKPPKKRGAVTPNSRKQLGRPERRRGRKPGPTRVMMNVRVLLETDDLVTEIGEETGMGPQDVTDVAIAHYAAHLRRTGRLPKVPKADQEEQGDQAEAS
ncbi:hypothetical protein ACFXEL_33105 [Streptomyces sp. NPDC059382]|uniref:hypothetical protein n=1 Tax=Streptomyces sp. NPDC059382 TaxID=3346816 RepID=UPI0036BFCE96